jgi:hypothetical protein
MKNSSQLSPAWNIMAMIRKNHLSNIDFALLQSIAFYFILAILLFPHYQYQINPDGVSYIGIAQKYIRQDFGNAINGYWGPLLSWLLAPFLLAGLKPLLAVKILSTIIGLIVIIQSNELIKFIKINQLFRTFLLYGLALCTIFYAFSEITPDLLLVCIALAYLNTILSLAYLHSKFAGIISGVLGAGLYLAKSYGLPFFLANFVIVNLIFYLRTQDGQDRARILSNFISGIVVFFLISAGWASLLSVKYGYFTTGTSGAYNHAILGPKALGYPMDYMGLLDPPNDTAISVWEDVSFIKIPDWGIFDSIGSLKHQLKITLENVRSIIARLNQFSVFSILVLIGGAFYLLKQGKRMVTDNLFYLMVSTAILWSGYLMLLVESRYIWLSNILIMIAGAKLLDLLFQKYSLSQTLKTILAVIFAASFAITPAQTLYYRRDTGKDIYDLSNRLSYLNIRGRIASNQEWGKTLHLSFYNDWKYYGEKGRLSSSELETEFENKMINYYFVWEPSEEDNKLVERYKEITSGSIDGLKVYQIK